jgi:hypothetical protein
MEVGKMKDGMRALEHGVVGSWSHPGAAATCNRCNPDTTPAPRYVSDAEAANLEDGDCLSCDDCGSLCDACVKAGHAAAAITLLLDTRAALLDGIDAVASALYDTDAHRKAQVNLERLAAQVRGKA